MMDLRVAAASMNLACTHLVSSEMTHPWQSLGLQTHV